MSKYGVFSGPYFPVFGLNTCIQSEYRKNPFHLIYQLHLENEIHHLEIHLENPFNFKHFSASQVAIYLNGDLHAPPLKLIFADNQYIDGYRRLFATAGRIDMDNGLDITRADYKSGCYIFGLHTSPSLCYGESQERKRNGTSQVTTEFRAPT